MTQDGSFSLIKRNLVILHILAKLQIAGNLGMRFPTSVYTSKPLPHSAYKFPLPQRLKVEHLYYYLSQKHEQKHVFMKSQFLLKGFPGSFDPPPFRSGQGGEEKSDFTQLRTCLKVDLFLSW